MSNAEQTTPRKNNGSDFGQVVKLDYPSGGVKLSTAIAQPVNSCGRECGLVRVVLAGMSIRHWNRLHTA